VPRQAAQHARQKLSAALLFFSSSFVFFLIIAFVLKLVFLQPESCDMKMKRVPTAAQWKL
jgi:hypothetical protein